MPPEISSLGSREQPHFSGFGTRPDGVRIDASAKPSPSIEGATETERLKVFWATLKQKWEREVHVFRQPFGAPVVSAEDNFRLVLSWADSVRSGDSYVDARWIEEDLLPNRRHETLADFCREI